ncbi:hypothetical protein N7512_001871 [Penicillium capsulatum]|nr:hypothetical protein N7512_001871 [Penicillium capsulatum]
MASNPQYDLVLLGPTGYTGNFCAEHIVQNHPTNLRWAIAGRSLQKMEPIAQKLKELNPDRVQPDVLVVHLNKSELDELTQKTRLIINCIGPYNLYSSPVVEACAASGTHYVDATGETPWVKQIIDKYHETAKNNAAIKAPPADLLTWALVKGVREELSSATRKVDSCIKEMKSSGASGGTFTTIMSVFDSMSMSDMYKSLNPFSLAASAPPKDIPRDSIVQKILGVHAVPDLGTLTTSPSGIADITIVHRSSTLLPELYGSRFVYHQSLYVRNAFIGVLFHVGIIIGVSLLALPPVRWLLRKWYYQPGHGPTVEASANDRLEYHAVATADQDTPRPTRVFGKFTYEGSMYVLTGLLLAEAAMVILDEEDKVRKVSRGGIVTAAMLGQDFVDRVEKVGCRVETKVLDY